ncbi:hypothetical protein Tco_1214797 [Tanacetum coccineum]
MDYGFELKAFADAGLAGCHDTRRSLLLVPLKFLDIVLLRWSSKKHKSTPSPLQNVQTLRSKHIDIRTTLSREVKGNVVELSKGRTVADSIGEKIEQTTCLQLLTDLILSFWSWIRLNDHGTNNCTKALATLEKTATGKENSNPLIADSLLNKLYAVMIGEDKTKDKKNLRT